MNFRFAVAEVNGILHTKDDHSGLGIARENIELL